MIRCTVTGNFNNTRNFLKRIKGQNFQSLLAKYGEQGVKALQDATPKLSGETADSWSYEITARSGSVSIFWTNSNVRNGVNIAVILDVGHGTGKGGYVQGRHYISPAIQPIFDKIAEAAWEEVTK